MTETLAARPPHQRFVEGAASGRDDGDVVLSFRGMLHLSTVLNSTSPAQINAAATEVARDATAEAAEPYRDALAAAGLSDLSARGITDLVETIESLRDLLATEREMSAALGRAGEQMLARLTDAGLHPTSQKD